LQQNILLVGGTGVLGRRIAYHLLNQPGARLRLMVRRITGFTADGSMATLLDRGATLVEGDLRDTASLDRATRAIDVIVSAVNGGADVIVDGQVALAEAGSKNGVRRILPSDFALDFFKTTRGEVAAFDRRSKAADAIGKTGIEHIHMLQGVFMDAFGPGSKMLDHENAVASFWGDGSGAFEVTSLDDAARVTARVALDEALCSGKFAFAGDLVSVQQAADLVEAHAGRAYERRSLGTEAGLRAELARARQSDLPTADALGGQLCVLTGQGALDDLQNRRYPDIQFETLADFFVHGLNFTSNRRRSDAQH
jgi:uncharacterized protein YbjT (DUF2867 family)